MCHSTLMEPISDVSYHHIDTKCIIIINFNIRLKIKPIKRTRLIPALTPEFIFIVAI